MNRSTPGLPVHHQLPEFTETHIHRVSDAIQPSHPLSSPSLLPPITPSIRVFSNKSTLRMRWPKCWSFSLSISYLLVADKVATLQVVLFCCQISCCHAILCNCVTQFSQASQDCWRVPFWRFSSELISCTAGTVFGLLLPVLSAPSFSLILIPSIQPPGSGSLYSSIVDILIPKGTAFPSAN